MKLYIDTSDSERISIQIDGKEFVTDAKKEKAQKLLQFILDTLETNELTERDIEEIEVNVGPGSFTGLRVGISVAQAIGFANDILVNGMNVRKGEIVKIKYE